MFFFATNYLRVVWCKVISAPGILSKFCSTNVVQVVGISELLKNHVLMSICSQ